MGKSFKNKTIKLFSFASDNLCLENCEKKVVSHV